MQFSVKRDILLKSLNFVQGVVEKKNTLPILSNVLLQLKNKKLSIVATDLDIVFYDEISELKILSEGSTTTSAAVLYDILRKISSNSDLNFDLKSENKLSLKSENSDFNLLCLPTDNFPTFSDEFNGEVIKLNNSKFLKLLNKTKISISADDTRHYLNGVFLHLTESNNKRYLTGVSTDSHRLSYSSIELSQNYNFPSIILPKKTVFQLCALLDNYDGEVKISNIKSKIKFELNNSILISKLIDGKFPNYIQVIPKNNKKKLEADLELFHHSVDRVASVSTDKKDGVRFSLSKNKLDLSVNNANSGDGKETLSVKFDHDLDISFNSKYLVDVASQLEGENIEIYFNDISSPALIKDPSDFDSIYVIMPMKG